MTAQVSPNEHTLWSRPEVGRWLHLHPEARTLAPHVDSYVQTIERYHQAETAHLRVAIDPYELEEIRGDLQAEAEAWSKRRAAEGVLAEYIRDVFDATGWTPPPRPDGRRPRTLLEIADDMDQCRRAGPVGRKPNGGLMVAWEHKCGQVRLCPDESREETQRLAEFYQPAMQDWCNESPTHRIFYAVFTGHNYRPGQLAHGKKHLFEKFKGWMNHQDQACPVRFHQAHGLSHVVRSRKRKMPPTFQNVKGAFVIQEDPLSAGGDWNVHLNTFLLVKGRFDYSVARELWGANVEFRELEGTPEALRHALLEAIKYSARTVPDKSADKASRHASEAPALTEWPHGLWAEWWQAQQGFRRTRAYGCLYALHGKRWDAMEVRGRVDLCAIADVDPAAAGNPWGGLAEEQRGALRNAMVHGERLDMSLVEWIGTVEYETGAGYRVDLIPEHNFSGSRENNSPHRPASAYYDTGPPPDYGTRGYQ